MVVPSAGSDGKSAAGRVRRRAGPLSPRPGPGRGAAVSCGGFSANQAARQKLNAQLTRAWWRRMAVSGRARAASAGVQASAPRAQVPRRGLRTITNGSPASASSPRNPSWSPYALSAATARNTKPAARARIAEIRGNLQLGTERRIFQQQLSSPVIDHAQVTPGLGQEELQPLHRPMLRSGHRLRRGQRRQRLVPVPQRQQPRQVSRWRRTSSRCSCGRFAGWGQTGRIPGSGGRELARNGAVGGLAAAAGLRLREFSYLLAAEVPALPGRPSELPVPFPVPAAVTKGRKFRTTWISYEALAGVHGYVSLERAMAGSGSSWRPPPRWGPPGAGLAGAGRGPTPRRSGHQPRR